MIESKSLGKKPSETLRRVARYYRDQGYDKRKTRRALEGFLLACDSTISIPKWADSIEFALSYSGKRSAVNIDKIVITEPELRVVDGLDSVMLRRLAFTILCVAKYWDAATGNTTHWVNSKDSDIMHMANINTSIKRQSAMYHTLYNAGLVRFSRKVDNTNVQVCFMADGDPAIEITDFRNLGYQYARLKEPNKYLVCAGCGIVVKRPDGRAGNSQKYCKDCAAEIALRNRVESVMRYREQKRA